MLLIQLFTFYKNSTKCGVSLVWELSQNRAKPEKLTKLMATTAYGANNANTGKAVLSVFIRL